MDSEFSSCDMLQSILQYGSSGPRNLPLEYLRNITNNFSDERILGEGGFGTVYKGVLPNGESMAVKKLNSSMPGVKDKQFENEAYHLMRLKHPNIVLLVGWCSETENIYVEYNGKYIWAEKSERLLCLEYMPKGNLRGYLSDESSGLTWETRYKIIKGICYGLHYLHEGRQLNAPIIHMDLKPANILLDTNMAPKIADFGMSRLFSEHKTWTCTISRDGTLGYMAPEYINRGLISTKSDIFSLGVIIIEIVTGQRDYPDESETEIPSQEFTELVLKNWRERLQKSLRYTSQEIDYQQIRRCIQIGLDCVKLDRWRRPTISQVIKMLHGSENADFSGRQEVMSLTNEVCQQQGVSTSEAPFEKKECQSRSIRGSHALDLPELGPCLDRRNSKRISKESIQQGVSTSEAPFEKEMECQSRRIRGSHALDLPELGPCLDRRNSKRISKESIQQGVNKSEALFEKKEMECQSRRLRRSHAFVQKRRSHALARLELDRPVSLPLTLTASAARSIDLVNSFRVGCSGDEGGDLRFLCESLGLSGPDDFAIPLADWEAYKAARPSRNTPTPAATRPDVKRVAAGDGGIKGALPPPLLKPPPPIVLPVVCWVGSTRDIFQSLAPR